MPLPTLLPLTPAELAAGGASLRIGYGYVPTPFGEVLVARTSKGICTVEFATDGRSEALRVLRRRFPGACLTPEDGASFPVSCYSSSAASAAPPRLVLHIPATPFRLRVWQTLLLTAPGHVITYGALAEAVGCPRACRAVGAAVGANPVALLIPCHRVVCSSGALGGYRWGTALKRRILLREAEAAGGTRSRPHPLF